MSLLERVKRLFGLAGTTTEPIDPNVEVHLEHPGVEEEMEPEGMHLEDIKGIGPTDGERLRTIGITAPADLAAADPADVAARADISETRVTTWIDRAQIRRGER